MTQAAIDKGLNKVEMEIRDGRAELGLEANRVEHRRPIRRVSWADTQEEEEEADATRE